MAGLGKRLGAWQEPILELISYRVFPLIRPAIRNSGTDNAGLCACILPSLRVLLLKHVLSSLEPIVSMCFLLSGLRNG